MTKTQILDIWRNKLYFGDCLEILKDFYNNNKVGFIDLVYIDPPFNSKRNYNILFEQADLKDTKAQREAFADTWSNISYKDTINDIKSLDLDLYNFLTSLDQIRISKSAIAYLTTMSIRIFYIHKVLKETGSFYLHCDSNMSHYLKIICDLIFGEANYQNEIFWKRSPGHNLSSKSFDKISDTILFYTKSKNYVFNRQFAQISNEEFLKKFPLIEQETGRRFNHQKLEKSSNAYNKEEFRIINGRKVSTNLGWIWTQETFDLRIKNNPHLIYWTESGRPRYKLYADEYEGKLISNIWDDIPAIGSNSSESLDYPTQKPEALLERIINASTNKGDLVADFFCGCGTAVDVSEKLERHWIGADISHLAIGLIERRLIDTYGNKVLGTYEIHGFPKDIASAKELASNVQGGRFEFQDWVIEAKIGGICNSKKTADGGWDGHMTFDVQGKKNVILIEVKSGNVNVKNLREFIQVVGKTKSDIGVFVCFAEQITKPMILAAKEEGYFYEEFFGNRYDKIQIISVEDLLDGKTLNYPESRKETFKKAEKKSTSKDIQQSLFN